MLRPGANDQPLDNTSGLFTGGVIREVEVDGFAGEATVLFDKKSKKLSTVTLFLKPRSDLTDLDKSLAYMRLRDDLLKKYGSPVGRTGCGEGDTECHLLFKSGGQSIDAVVELFDGVPLLLHIAYESSSILKGI
jgi:hypothetical protein